MDLLPENQTSPLAISDRLYERESEATHCEEKDVPAKKLVALVYDLVREELAGQWASMELLRSKCNYVVVVEDASDEQQQRFGTYFRIDRQRNVVDRWLGH